MSDVITVWVRESTEGGWCAGIGTSVMFMGFSDEQAAWTWMREHLKDKHEAAIRAEERQEIIETSKRAKRDAELALVLAQMPVPKKRKELH